MHPNTSYPFLSVDFLIELADVHIMNPSDKIQIESFDIPIIFVRTEILYHCIDALMRIQKPFILITGCNDDMCIPYYSYPSNSYTPMEKLLENTQLLKWYSKNVCIQHPKMVAIPIGPKMQWRSSNFFGEDKSHTLHVYRSICLQPAISFLDTSLKQNLLYINMNVHTTNTPYYKEHTGIRSNAIKHFTELGFPISENKPMKEYLLELQSHKFCISPPGRGIDAHRTWEALMVGTIPICISSSLDHIYEHLPVVVVSEYSIITHEYLEKIYPQILSKQYNFSMLFCDYWRDVIFHERNTHIPVPLSIPTRKIHIFMTGPIRPSLEFVIDNIQSIKILFGNVVTHLLYWKTNNTDDEIQLKKYFDHVYPVSEPPDDEIYEKITCRSGQQRHHKTLEHWTLSMYRMFYGIRKLIQASKIDNSDIIIRVRTDLHFDIVKNITNILKNIQQNAYYFCPRANGGNACDWFSISDFQTFKSVWYFKNDSTYNEAISNAWNAELLLVDNAKNYDIKMIDIHSCISMGLCRKYTDRIPTLQYMHP